MGTAGGVGQSVTAKCPQRLDDDRLQTDWRRDWQARRGLVTWNPMSACCRPGIRCASPENNQSITRNNPDGSMKGNGRSTRGCLVSRSVGSWRFASSRSRSIQAAPARRMALFQPMDRRPRLRRVASRHLVRTTGSFLSSSTTKTGIDGLMTEIGLAALPKGRKAVLVGTALSPGQPNRKADGL